MVIRLFPRGTATTAPRFAFLKSYSRFIAFPILQLFPCCCSSGRNYSYIVSAPGIDHDEQATQRIHSERDPPFFTRRKWIADSDRQLVFQRSRGVSKIDSVFREIRTRFRGIPLVTHISSICTFVHIRPVSSSALRA